MPPMPRHGCHSHRTMHGQNHPVRKLQTPGAGWPIRLILQRAPLPGRDMKRHREGKQQVCDAPPASPPPPPQYHHWTCSFRHSMRCKALRRLSPTDFCWRIDLIAFSRRWPQPMPVPRPRCYTSGHKECRLIACGARSSCPRRESMMAARLVVLETRRARCVGNAQGTMSTARANESNVSHLSIIRLCAESGG